MQEEKRKCGKRAQKEEVSHVEAKKNGRGKKENEGVVVKMMFELVVSTYFGQFYLSESFSDTLSTPPNQ